MTTPRIYYPHTLKTDTLLELEEEYLRYLKTVLRLKEGDKLILFDGMGFEYGAHIEAFHRHSLSLKVSDAHHIPFPDRGITLAQSLPKGTKMDFIIQKATELGVSRIIPFISSRSIPILSGEKAAARHKRWTRIAIEASKQCGRTKIPELLELSSFDDMLDLPSESSHKIIFWEAETERGLKTILKNSRHEEKKDFFIIVGPEGGFAWHEIEASTKKGFLTASLGRNILRVETSSLAIISILQFELGTIGSMENTEEIE